MYIYMKINIAWCFLCDCHLFPPFLFKCGGREMVFCFFFILPILKELAQGKKTFFLELYRN